MFFKKKKMLLKLQTNKANLMTNYEGMRNNIIILNDNLFFQYMIFLQYLFIL